MHRRARVTVSLAYHYSLDCTDQYGFGSQKIVGFNDHSPSREKLIKLEFVVLPVLGPDPAHRSGDRAHDHRVGLNDRAVELQATSSHW